ncbi:MAG: hypothetical protein HOA06_10085 [Chloroflexi bacterium]|jgi:hypothetical protein|nr:hypothetical protein [Chloroflexota bacterium]MBT7538641.1 hypothetical protein [Gammaproteobacteria bacterium]
MQLDELIGKYIKIRDAKDALKKTHSEELSRFNNALDKIEHSLLAEFNETGQESAKTAHGTAYRSVRTSAKVADRDAFFDFVRQNDAYDFLESRANKNAVEAYMEEHDELPPGIDVSRVTTINVRRS